MAKLYHSCERIAALSLNIYTAMSDAISLASSLPLPVPASESEETFRRVPSKRQGLKSNSSKSSKTEDSTENVVPYQALPVQGPLISLNYTPALAVLEPDHLRKEVGRWRQYGLFVV